jgi:hypothetical protein
MNVNAPKGIKTQMKNTDVDGLQHSITLLSAYILFI